MRRLTMALCIMAMASVAHAGSYTVTTTPEQDQALAQVAAQTKGTPQQAVQFIVDRNLMTRVEAIKRSSDRTAACAKVTDAQARVALGCAPTK